MQSASPERDFLVKPWSNDMALLRSDFDCGVESLDSYLKMQASQDVKKRACAFFAAMDKQKNRIAGFYTLAMYSVVLVDMPPGLRKKLPRYPLVPAVLLGRLAVDREYRGRGLGEFLLLDSMKRSLGNDISWWAMVVDALDGSREFYKKYGFIQFADAPNRLFLPYATVTAAFGTPGGDPSL